MVNSERLPARLPAEFRSEKFMYSFLALVKHLVERIMAAKIVVTTKLRVNRQGNAVKLARLLRQGHC